MQFKNFYSIAILTLVGEVQCPIARVERKQNGGIPVWDVQSRDGAGTKWRWQSVEN
jgi:hypothetical protein